MTFLPLQKFPEARASFTVYNSPLSETAPLGFEYGYSVQAPDSLVLWEAQYGDFANVAQVIIDQFLASGRAKWRQDSSVVMLLPHGYEGNGPEHSSARLERYLHLAAEDNWRVANCSTAAQYFHLLRLQAYLLSSYPRPLIIMTPKSLLRHPLASSRLSDLVEGSFQSVINDPRASQDPKAIRRVVFCTGKIAIDLLSHESRMHNEDTAIVRVELLYPFPKRSLKRVLEMYTNASEFIWVQEEPRNMGTWDYIAPRIQKVLGDDKTLRVIARPERSSPAAGFWDIHAAEQEQIIKEAAGVSVPQKETGGKHVR